MTSKTQRVTNLRKAKPGREGCQENGCLQPLGTRGEGFTLKGLQLHKVRLHNSNGNAGPVATSAEFADVFNPGLLDGIPEPVDYGTPGDEVVMGGIGTLDNNSFMEDVKQVIDADWEYNQYVTPDFNEDGSVRGWFVRGRNACCQWTAKGKGYNHGANHKCKGYFVSIDAGAAGRHYAPSIYAPQIKRHAPDSYKGPVEPLDNEGVRVKARNGVLYVDGQPADLQAFIDGLRLAVRIS